MTDMDPPLVSVIILSFNRKDQLGETLSRLAQQSYRHLETIVVENGSSDGTAVRKPSPRYCEHSLSMGGGFICKHPERLEFVNK